MGIIFCSIVALVWTFNTRGVYNFITKEANIPVNLVLFFNDNLFLFCRFLKSGWSTELNKKSFCLEEEKSQSYLFQTGQNFAAHKMLVWSTYVWRTATASFFLKKSNIWARSSFESNSFYLKKWQRKEHVFLFQLTLTINIIPNITL